MYINPLRINKAVKNLKKHQSSGPAGIPAELNRKAFYNE